MSLSWAGSFYKNHQCRHPGAGWKPDVQSLIVFLDPGLRRNDGFIG
jgi:hypothetical protein